MFQNTRSTEYLKLLAENDCRLVVDPGVPPGKPKHEFVVIKHRDGRNLILRTPSGYVASPVELHPAIFADFLVESLVERDGSENAEGRVTYRLTAEGRRRGLS